jgi:hypothetical protein
MEGPYQPQVESAEPPQGYNDNSEPSVGMRANASFFQNTVSASQMTGAYFPMYQTSIAIHVALAIFGVLFAFNGPLVGC